MKLEQFNLLKLLNYYHVSAAMFSTKPQIEYLINNGFTEVGKFGNDVVLVR